MSKSQKELIDDALHEYRNPPKAASDLANTLLPSKPSDDQLERIIEIQRRFPTPEWADLLKIRCKRLLEKGDMTEAAILLHQSQANAFRHKFLAQHNRRIKREQNQREETKEEKMKRQKSSKDLFIDSDDEVEENLDISNSELVRDVLYLQSSSSSETLPRLLKELPSSWRVVHITVKPDLHVTFKSTPSDVADEKRNFDLIVSAFSCGQDVKCALAEIPRLENSGRYSIMKLLQDILHDHTQLYSKSSNDPKQPEFNKASYIQRKKEIDSELQCLLDTIESVWLGCAKLLLLGKPVSEVRTEKIRTKVVQMVDSLDLQITEAQNHLLFYILDGFSLLNASQIKEACLWITKDPKTLKSLMSLIKKESEDLIEDHIERSPVALVLDREVQMIPWESLPMLSGHPYSRVPSIFFLIALYNLHKRSNESVTKNSVRDVYFVIDPDQNLPKTKKALIEPFRELGSEGVVGEWPSKSSLEDVLLHKDAFIYCGHGHRLKTLTGQQIEGLDVRALPLLFGCSSGKLERLGRTLDPLGTSHSYLIATSPCLLGFLWSITDRDVDAFTIKFLNCWLSKNANKDQKDFVKVVAEKRHEFNTFTNSAALVVYGLPAFLKQS